MLFRVIGGNILMLNVWEGGLYILANNKSTEKRIRQTEKRTDRNSRLKSILKTSIRRFEEALQANDQDVAQGKLVAATRQIDKAVAKGILHKNTAARKKSRLARMLNQKASG